MSERQEQGKGSIRAGCARMVLGLIALGGLYFAYLVWSGFFASDTCLDRGGSYHYDTGECSFTENYVGELPSLWPF
jgi:hypothetical protein